jgi:death on curing protein
MRFLTLSEVLEIHRRVMEQSGGPLGIRDLGALESAIAQPRITFDGKDLYPALIEKASALAFSIINNHPFLDGNKRAGHAVLEAFLVLNGFEIGAGVDDQELTVLKVASGRMNREGFTEWRSSYPKKEQLKHWAPFSSAATDRNREDFVQF